jgi:hypothetical protein
VVEPGHLGYFSNQNNYHLQDLLVACRALIHQKLNQVVFDGQFLANFDFKPMVYEDLFDAVGCEILRIAVARTV